MNTDTWVIVPGFNEETYIDTVLLKIGKETSNIIYVDDGSSDQSVFIAKKRAKHVLAHQTNLGKGAALKTGCEFAFETLQAKAVIFMDADDQHDPKEIPKFIFELTRYDMVFGVRKLDAAMPVLKFLQNKGASILLNLLYGGYIPDIPSGYKAMTKKGYQKVRWKSPGYEVETEIAMRVAKEKVSFTTIDIETIYHDSDKGMTMLDALHICSCLIQWRLGI